MRGFLLLLVLILGSSGNLLAKANNISKEIYREYSESIFLISDEEDQPDKNLVTFGTAFAIDKTGHLLTSAHLVQKHSLIQDDQERVYPILDVAWIDKELDLAIVKVAGRFKPIPLTSSHNSEVGEEITIISNPLGLQNTLSKGILSAKRQQNGTLHLQHTSPISVGSSGGPIFNEKGEVIAIVQRILTAENSQNLNFGISCEYIPEEYLTLNKNQSHSTSIALKEQSGFNQSSLASNIQSTKTTGYTGLLSSLDLTISFQPDNFEDNIFKNFAKQKKTDYLDIIQNFSNNKKAFWSE